MHAARKHREKPLPTWSVARILTRRCGFRISQTTVREALADWLNDDGDVDPLKVQPEHLGTRF